MEFLFLVDIENKSSVIAEPFSLYTHTLTFYVIFDYVLML
jgi:hypothetical protein